MKAELLLRERQYLDSSSFAELRLWRVGTPVRGSAHGYKYSLAYVVDRLCVVRYDNEAGKGDHKHIGGEEFSYLFSTPEQALTDFWSDVDRWRAR